MGQRKIQCSCGKRYLVDESLVGKQFTCKVCGATFTIPPLDKELLELIHEDDPKPKRKRKKKR